MPGQDPNHPVRDGQGAPCPGAASPPQRRLSASGLTATAGGRRAAQATIEAELGKPMSSVFESVDPKPLASASIAQVHTAVLKGAAAAPVVKPRLAAAPRALGCCRRPAEPRRCAAAEPAAWLAAESRKEVVLKVLKPDVVDQLTGAHPLPADRKSVV